jgi:hypothetical protein
MHNETIIKPKTERKIKVIEDPSWGDLKKSFEDVQTGKISQWKTRSLRAFQE